MLQTLLAERFKLSQHVEKREQPVYALTVGGGSLKLRKSSNTDGGVRGCKGALTGRRTCTNATMNELANMLAQLYRMKASAPPGMNVSWAPDRYVVDRTGLTEGYDFTLTLGPVEGSPEVVLSAEEAVRALGLRLERAKAPLQYLMVDRIERVPTDN
jgi:uncharacterized protein (TIGR03435 family)